MLAIVAECHLCGGFTGELMTKTTVIQGAHFRQEKYVSRNIMELRTGC